MQMLQQYLGEQGVRYATFLLVAVGLLIAVLIVWVLIRKALGSRLNFSEKPDRRGRAPRLGITESFNVDREGRRLVIVRRDNFEHLVMIGGPNDVVIETTILRGERLTAGRNDQRAGEQELIPLAPRQITETLQPALAAPLPQAVLQPAPAQKTIAQPIPAAQNPVLRRPDPAPQPIAPTAPPKAEIKLPEPVVAQARVATPVTTVTPPPLEPLKVPAPDPVDILPADKATLPKVASLAAGTTAAITTAASSVASSSQDVAASAKAAVKKILSSKTTADQEPERAAPVVVSEPSPLVEQAPPKPVTPKLTLAERIKSGAFFGSKNVMAEPPPPPVAVVKKVLDIPQVQDVPEVKIPEIKTPQPVNVAPALTKPIETAPTKPSAGAFMAEMRELGAASPAVKSPDAGFGDASTAGLKVPDVSEMPQSLRPKPPTPVPQAPIQAEPKPAPAPQVPIPPRPASKNPFDSLEEEMAKLLGRTPDGKG
jgi:flagellar protein FliO/FliZ